MFYLYIPYGTDAPIYHRPIVTMVMIAINVLVFVLFSPEQIRPYMLVTGAGLHPVQWLTTNFLHADIFHLIFNMLFLWVFALVVEGKLGTLKTLAVYLGIGILYGATVQIMMLGNERPIYCLGASAVINGLAVMCLIWAPSNRIHAYLIYWFICFVGIKGLETKISILVGIFLALDIARLCLSGGRLSTPLLHLMGAFFGLIVGLAMLKTNLVDCEHWDIFSVWAGTNTLTDKERAKIERNKPKAIKQRAEARQKRQNLLAEEIERALDHHAPLPAFLITQRKEREFTDWTLPQTLHFKLIQQLLGGKHWSEAIMSMRRYLERHQEQSAFVRLMLAQALLTQNKPSAAMKVLDDIVLEGLNPEQQSAIRKIRAKADAMHRKNLEEGTYELDD